MRPSPVPSDPLTSPQAPSRSPLLLYLTTPPFSLLFDPPTQRLLRIELTGDKAGEWVSYRGKSLCEVEGEDVVRRVRRVMGPTYGGPWEGEEEMLCYPGVALGVVRGAEGEVVRRVRVGAERWCREAIGEDRGDAASCS